LHSICLRWFRAGCGPVADLLAGAPAELRARIHAAFQVHASTAPRSIKPPSPTRTPGIIRALIADYERNEFRKARSAAERANLSQLG